MVDSSHLRFYSPNHIQLSSKDMLNMSFLQVVLELT